MRDTARGRQDDRQGKERKREANYLKAAASRKENDEAKKHMQLRETRMKSKSIDGQTLRPTQKGPLANHESKLQHHEAPACKRKREGKITVKTRIGFFKFCEPTLDPENCAGGIPKPMTKTMIFAASKHMLMAMRMMLMMISKRTQEVLPILRRKQDRRKTWCPYALSRKRRPASLSLSSSPGSHDPNCLAGDPGV